jgi:lathosterol oxidase
LIRAHNIWKNELVLGAVLPPAWREALPHAAQTWLRNCLLAAAICVLPGAAWIAAQALRGAPGAGPGGLSLLSRPSIHAQLLASFRAIPGVTLLPTAVEAAAEAGWTRAYARVSDASSPAAYVISLVIYMLAVEYGVYLVHRTMHSVPWLYKNVHCVHHAFNKEHTMSPFAGLAVHSAGEQGALSHPATGVVRWMQAGRGHFAGKG